MTVVAVPGLAVMGLLFLFLLLGRSTVNATPDVDNAITDLRSQNAAFTVSGTVTCEATGLISDVEVYAWNRDRGTGFVGDVTDISGTYSVTLEESSYDLIFNPPCGSECASRSLKGVTGPPDLTLDVVLLSGHSVSGTVFDVNGSIPISNVEIYAFNYGTADGFGLPPTDANGHYCIGLVEGHYDLGFTPPPCLGLGPTGKSVTVTQDITLNVVLTSGFTMAGCVTKGIGDPVSGVQIYAYDPEIRGFGFSPTDESGCYTGTLPLGTFDIQFIPPGGQGLGSVTVVDVISETANCPNTPLPITLPAGPTISGRGTCQGEPVKNVFVYADPEGGVAPGDNLVGWGLYTVDDGSYELPVVPGIYDVEFVPPPATGFDTMVVNNVQVFTDTVLNVDFCAPVKWVDELFAVPGERRTYQVVLTPTQDIATARLTDTLPSAVSWAGDLSATNGNASYSDGAVTWSGALTTGAPLTITYGVTVTHAPCCGTAAHTDIYTDVYNDALLDDGQGNILYSTPAVLAIGNPFGTGSGRAFDVAFGDADGDGHLDLAVGNHVVPNQMCWNNGDGAFDCGEAFEGGPTFDVDWGDMDGDGYLDVVVTNSQWHSNWVCLNNKDRTFNCTSFSTCSFSSFDAALGDVDDDGVDIALGGQYAQDLIYYNEGDGLAFITDTICYDGATQDQAFGDVDDDDDLDLAVVGIGPDFVCINDGTGHFTEIRWLAYRLDAGTWSVALGDADGDGDLDVAAGEATDYPIELYLNNGYGYFTETLPLLIGPAWDSTGGLAWGDVDCDGDLDLATGNRYQQTVVYFNDPVTATNSITFSRKVFLGTDSSGINSVAFGDVDGDGDLDLAVGSDGGQNVVYLNTLVGADVEIVKSSQPTSTLAPGDRLTYTLVYRNNGCCEAANVVITDVVPITLAIESVTSSDAQIKPIGSVSYTWQVEDLPPGTGGVITITSIVSPSASGVFSLTNQAIIIAASGCCADKNLGNNTSVVHNTVDAERPDPPTLTSPADGTFTSTNELTLIWAASPSPDVTGYLLDFNGEISDVGNIIQTTTAVLPDGIYTWTVAAYDAVSNASPYTDVWSFEVDATPPDTTICVYLPLILKNN